MPSKSLTLINASYSEAVKALRNDPELQLVDIVDHQGLLLVRLVRAKDLMNDQSL